ncbi:MAG: MoaD/ThiS family protein [Planctomycetaceae bacterium]
MPRVFIPPLLKPLTGGVDVVEMSARSVREVVEKLERQFPGVRERLIEDGDLKPGLTIAVDGNVSAVGLLQRIGENSEVHFLPAIGGG